ncbi:hypothetical protein G6F61_004750 [Rhizopus arrhizus]|nr:hypothetical protein G6F61_004750 [Rhizopus arrhizus]
MQNKTNFKRFHPYSPEYHNVIQIGRGNSRRLNLDEDLYHYHLRSNHNIYSGKQGLEQGEATFNDLLIFPSLKAIAKAIVEYDDNSEADFKVGKVPLKQ